MLASAWWSWWRSPGYSAVCRRKRFLSGVLTGAILVGALCSAAVPLGIVPQVLADDDASKKPKGFYYDPGGHRDPFGPLVRDGRLVGVPTGRSPTDTTMPVLYGILWDPDGQSIALINDGEAKTGDTIAGYQVKEIRKDAVVLSHGGEPLVLQMIFDAPAAKTSPGTTTGGGSR